MQVAATVYIRVVKIVKATSYIGEKCTAKQHFPSD